MMDTQIAELRRTLEALVSEQREHGERVDDALRSISDQLDLIDEALRGSMEPGSPQGLIARVDDNEADIAEMRQDRKWLYRLVVGAVITAVIYGVAGIVEALGGS